MKKTIIISIILSIFIGCGVEPEDLEDTFKPNIIPNCNSNSDNDDLYCPDDEDYEPTCFTLEELQQDCLNYSDYQGEYDLPYPNTRTYSSLAGTNYFECRYSCLSDVTNPRFVGNYDHVYLYSMRGDVEDQDCWRMSPNFRMEFNAICSCVINEVPDEFCYSCGDIPDYACYDPYHPHHYDY